MDAWFLPNMCIRVFAGQYLSPEERFALNVATGGSEHNSSVVVRCYRIIRYDEVQRIIREILMPGRVQFMVLRGHGVEPVQILEEDAPHPDMLRIHSVPTTLVVIHNGDAERVQHLAKSIQRLLLHCVIHRHCRVIRCEPGTSDAVDVAAVIDNCLYAERVRVLSSADKLSTLDVFPMVLGAAQEAVGSDPERTRPLFMQWLLDLQTRIVGTTDYDLPLTWVVTRKGVKCTEAEDWFERFGNRLYRSPELHTLPTTLRVVFARTLTHDWRSPYTPSVVDSQPWELIYADEGDVVTSAVLRRKRSDHSF